MLINKTEIALQTTNNPLQYLLMRYVHPDIYSATSLHALIEGFREQPPRKKVILNNHRIAFVETHNTEFLLYPNLLERTTSKFLPHTQDDEEYHVALKSGKGLPYFILRYNDMKVGATWNESIADFRRQTFEFGISTERFTPIQKSILGYWQYDPEISFLFVHRLGSYRALKKEKSTTRILAPQLT